MIPLIPDQGPGDWLSTGPEPDLLILQSGTAACVKCVPDGMFESDTHVRVKMCTFSWCHLQMLYLCIFYKKIKLQTVIRCHLPCLERQGLLINNKIDIWGVIHVRNRFLLTGCRFYRTQTSQKVLIYYRQLR